MFLTLAATFTRLSGAPLISMMQKSSHLGNSLDAPVFWLVHRPWHRRIFGQC
jgi:hypothetical protein